MDEQLEFADLLAPIEALGTGDVLECWRWLAPPGAHPLLLTALGDLFVSDATGTIWFIDSHEGSLSPVAPDRPSFQQALRDPSLLDRWFAPNWSGRCANVA